MRQRVIIVVLAILLGLVAAFMVTSYADQARNQALVKAELVEVLFASDSLPVGLTIDDLLSRKLVEVKKVPKEFVPEDAVVPGGKLGGRVLAVSLNAGEQLTTDKFKVSKDAGLAFTIPEGMVAVAIPIDDMKAAGNLVKIGDYVNVVGTAKSSQENSDYMTKTILQKVRVLAVGSSLENQEKSARATLAQASSGNDAGGKTGKTVTVALTQADAEKLVFMQDQGRIWLTLLPSKQAKSVSTSGQTLESVFK